MELTATNRSQAYPKAENGYRHPGVDGNTEWFQTGTDGWKPLRSKGTDENAQHFWKYPGGSKDDSFEANGRVTKKSRKRLAKSGWI